MAVAINLLLILLQRERILQIYVNKELYPVIVPRVTHASLTFSWSRINASGNFCLRRCNYPDLQPSGRKKTSVA